MSTLGLVIGATALMFSVVKAVLIEPLPYPEPHQLVWGWGQFDRCDRASVSPADFLDYLQIERLIAGDGHDGGAGERSPGGAALQDVLAARDVVEDVLPVRTGIALPDLPAPGAFVEEQLGLRNDAALRVENPSREAVGIRRPGQQQQHGNGDSRRVGATCNFLPHR